MIQCAIKDPNGNRRGLVNETVGLDVDKQSYLLRANNRKVVQRIVTGKVSQGSFRDLGGECSWTFCLESR